MRWFSILWLLPQSRNKGINALSVPRAWQGDLLQGLGRGNLFFSILEKGMPKGKPNVEQKSTEGFY